MNNVDLNNFPSKPKAIQNFLDWWEKAGMAEPARPKFLRKRVSDLPAIAKVRWYEKQKKRSREMDTDSEILRHPRETDLDSNRGFEINRWPW